MTARVLVGDCREVLSTMEANSIDACVTDPPYGLEFMGKEWDRLTRNLMLAPSEADQERLERYGTKQIKGIGRNPDIGAATKHGKAMQAWHETWARSVYRVLKPGAHLLAFGGTRTSHRMVCAIEDAGFEIRDCLMWLYGSGFPKSLDVSKALDKAAGVEREVVGIKDDPRYQYTYANSTKGVEAGHKYGKFNGTDGAVVGAETAPATDLARHWDGWGTALKPSYEPIVLARKPLAGTVAANVTQYGTGALNINGCRIGTDGGCELPDGEGGFDAGTVNAFGGHLNSARSPQKSGLGRWPANAIFDEDAARLLDEMSGERPSGGPGVTKQTMSIHGPAGLGSHTTRETINYGDTGGASRFFYTAKASRAERNKGLAGMPVSAVAMHGAGIGEGNDPDAPIIERNSHPTVKPVDLMQWLVRLVTPKGGTVLDPFMGSGSTGIAADREGMHFIGIEQDPEYAEIARKRIVGDCPLFTTLAAD